MRAKERIAIGVRYAFHSSLTVYKVLDLLLF